MRRAEGKCDAGFGASGHQLHGSADVPAEADDAIEVMKRNAEFCFSFVTDLHGLAILKKPRAFEGDEKRVEMLHHKSGGA